MGIRGKAAALGEFLTEIVEVLLIEATFQKRARVVAGGTVALKVDDICRLAIVAAPEKVVVSDLIKSGRGSVGRDVSTKSAVLAVRVYDHRHGIPTKITFDAGFD